MIGWRSTVVLGLAAATLAVPVAAQTPQNPAVFRSKATAVSLDVSVKRGNLPVSALSAADFTVTDNGAPQIVEQASSDLVPIDVTIVLDASGSVGSIFDDIRRDAQRILGLLRPDDRTRILVIDTTPYELLPLQTIGRGLAVPQKPELGMTSVYDALLAGLVARPDPDRRRLLVAITDGRDNKSIISVQSLEGVARRTDTVLHVISVLAEPGVGVPPARSATLRPSRSFVRDEPTKQQIDLFERLPALTGGAFHAPRRWLGGKVDAVGTMRSVIEEFRRSYVIQYTPRNVEPGGWHDVVVGVKGLDPKGVRARAGYFDHAR